MNNEAVLVKLADLIGTPYGENTRAYITQCTGRTRVVGPNDIATMEFDDQRIHVIAGGNGLIEGFRFA